MSWYTLGENNYATLGYNLEAQDGILTPTNGVGLVDPIPGFIDYGNIYCNGEMFGWNNWQFDVTPEYVAEIIRNHEDWNGENIRLLSCCAGKYQYGAAYKIAIDLGVCVLAPIDLVHINNITGEMYVIDADASQIDNLIAIGDSRMTPEWQASQWVLFTP